MYFLVCCVHVLEKDKIVKSQRFEQYARNPQPFWTTLHYIIQMIPNEHTSQDEKCIKFTGHILSQPHNCVIHSTTSVKSEEHKLNSFHRAYN